MTCIVSFKDKTGGVWMASDSAGTANDWTTASNYAPKIYANGGYLFGFTTSYRMGQIIGASFHPPQPFDPGADPDLGLRLSGPELYHFMIRTFITELRSCLAVNGWNKKENERESGGTFLAAVDGRVFQIQDDYSVIESGRRFDAVGSGGTVALGAFCALDLTGQLDKHSPDTILRTALVAAQDFNAAVRSPFYIVGPNMGLNRVVLDVLQ